MHGFIKSFLSIFRKKKIVFLGRDGFIFIDGDSKYLIDSEMLAGPEYHLVVYNDRVCLKENGQEIIVDDQLKKIIIEKVMKELNRMGLRAYIHGDF